MHSPPFVRLDRVTKIYPVEIGDFVVEFARVLSGRPASRAFPASGNTAVDGVSMEIRSGERVGIIGPNGAGKSTLVHLIANITAPTRGTVDVAGRVTAVMTLGVGLRDDLSGRENIYVDGELQGRTRPEMDRVIGQIIEFAELQDFIEMPVRTYSTGMKARLAFAMISCIEPEILVIDEALSVGDAFFAVKARQKIRELCDAGRIVIVVSHDTESIRRICDRCLWMESGRIVMDGDPVTITTAYAEHVRARDEALLLSRLPGAAREVTLTGGVESLDLAIRHAGEKEARTLVQSGRDVSITASIRADRLIDHPALRLVISRLDGSILIESLSRIVWRQSGGGFACEAEARLNPLRLNRGLYVCRLELTGAGSLVAARSTAFEVAASSTLLGGNPMLLWPCTIHSQRI